MVIEEFVDPLSKARLSIGENGNLYSQDGNPYIVYVNHDGSYDFVSSHNEQCEKDY